MQPNNDDRAIDREDRETIKVKAEGVNKTLDVGGDWLGERPDFRSLRWIVDR
jgi:hypothetical protein